MNPLRLITIPHTGTNYLAAVLRDRMGQKVKIGHFGGGNYSCVDAGEAAVAAFRDPALWVSSCLKRGERVDVELWAEMARWRRLKYVHFVHVGGDWDVEMTALARFVGFSGDYGLDPGPIASAGPEYIEDVELTDRVWAAWNSLEVTDGS